MKRNEWFKSSFSNRNGSCVETRGDWFKSSFSDGNGSCVEILKDVHIRDSKWTGDDVSEQPSITMPARAWDPFLRKVVDQSSAAVDGMPDITVHGDGGATIQADDGTRLVYTAGEWEAFKLGIHAGEFAAY